MKKSSLQKVNELSLQNYSQILTAFYMKLQIINRLSLNSNNNLDTMLTVRRQTQPIINPQVAQFNPDAFQPNYYSIRDNQQGGFALKAQYSSNFVAAKQDYKAFFNNFDRICTIKYEEKAKIEPNHRRKLEKELKIAMMDRQNVYKPHQSVNKHLNTQQTNYSKPKNLKVSSLLELGNYYLGQNRHKDRIRKISSLVSIRAQQPTELSRKPGFILKKNSSLIKRIQTEQLTMLQDALYNKENLNPNAQPTNQKKSGSNVDRQIWQSKERIAQIRKELNEIYEMRRQPNSFKLKLF